MIMIPIMTLLISIVQMMHTVICISKGWKRFRSSNTSIILSGLKIGINGIGLWNIDRGRINVCIDNYS